MNYFARLSFKTKLIISFLLTLVITLSFISTLLIKIATQRALDDNKEQLSLLTEQVLINYEQTIHNTEKQLYNILNSLNIPPGMRAVIESNANTQAVRDLQYSVNLMVSSSRPFDFVMVETLNGVKVHTGGKMYKGELLASQAGKLLEDDELGENNYGKCIWKRTEGGNIYVVRDVYKLSPLQLVGKVIVRMYENELFKLSSGGERLDCNFLFFDHKNEHIVTIGNIDEKQQQIIVRSINEIIDRDNQVKNARNWNGIDYYYSISIGENWKAVGLIPMSRLNSMKSAVLTTSLLISVIGLFMGLFVVTMLTKGLSRQLNSIIQSMDAVSRGNINQVVPILSEDDIGQLAVNFNNMTREISELMQRIVEEEKSKKAVEYQLLEYRYRSLQSQINPHFIYNALETVNALAKLDNNAAVARVVQLISRYFRQYTKSMNARFITLRREFSNLKDYTEIYRYIYGEKLIIKFDCPEDICDALIPTMIFQPILENAMIHGIKNTDNESLVIVSAKSSGNRIVVSITDYGPGMSEETREKILSEDAVTQNSFGHTGIGLKNVIERLRLIYGEDVNFEIESSEEGTTIRITMPINYITSLDNSYTPNDVISGDD